MILLMERFQNLCESCFLMADEIDKCVDFCSDWVWGWLRRGTSIGTD